MPSSLLFAGLVATWLAVLVPMAARRRQPMSRPSDAALSCRVLERPRRRDSEVTAVDASNSAVPNNVTPNSVTPNISGPNIPRPNSGGRNISGPKSAGANDAPADEGTWDESSGYADDHLDQRHADRAGYSDHAGYSDDADYADHAYADPRYADGEYTDQEYSDREYAGHEYADGHYAEQEDAAEPARRFRPGRGGYDAAAAAAAAQARYVVRQRLVLTLVLLAVATGLLAGGLHLAGGWYLHAGVDLCLVGYLVYLRRQVRVEQAIRARRAARMAGSRYRADHDADAERGSPLLDDPLGEEPEPGQGAAYAHGPGVRHTAGPMVRRGRRSRVRRRPTVGEAVAAREAARRAETEAASGAALADPDDERAAGYEDDYDDGYEHDGGDRGADYSADYSADEEDELGDDGLDQQSALPRLRPSALPERPRGTVVLELDDEDPELHDLDSRPERGYRRASGQ